jgi:hypothetical protein
MNQDAWLQVAKMVGCESDSPSAITRHIKRLLDDSATLNRIAALLDTHRTKVEAELSDVLVRCWLMEQD